jgi:hypothetical protein
MKRGPYRVVQDETTGTVQLQPGDLVTYRVLDDLSLGKYAVRVERPVRNEGPDILTMETGTIFIGQHTAGDLVPHVFTVHRNNEGHLWLSCSTHEGSSATPNYVDRSTIRDVKPPQ